MEKQAELDVRIFAEYVVPILGIRSVMWGQKIIVQPRLPTTRL